MGANPIMGEVEFDVNGARYVFALNYWARAQIQKRTGKTFAQLFSKADQGFGELEILNIFAAGLDLRHQLTDQEVATLLQYLAHEQGHERAAQLIMEALNLSFPKIMEVAKSNGNFPKPDPTNGIGIGPSPNG
jgi:hypothetical protein